MRRLKRKVTGHMSLTQSEDFCRREYEALLRYVYPMTGSYEDSLEIAQESFLTFYQMQAAGQVREHERALLFRLARNKAIDLGRRRQTRQDYAQQARRENVIPLTATDERTPEMILLEKERRRCADAALERLGERDRECLSLRRSGLSYREIAEVLHVNPNSISQVINRALRRFEQNYHDLLGQKHEHGKRKETGR
jgi:RNA polymerase sigma-70 factor (ECF subfamily)